MTFKDVTDDNVHKEAIEEMAELGIMVGVTPNMFQPHVFVSRGQLASVISRLLEVLKDTDGS